MDKDTEIKIRQFVRGQLDCKVENFEEDGTAILPFIVGDCLTELNLPETPYNLVVVSAIVAKTLAEAQEPVTYVWEGGNAADFNVTSLERMNAAPELYEAISGK